MMQQQTDRSSCIRILLLHIPVTREFSASATGESLFNFLYGMIFLGLACIFYHIGRTPREKIQKLCREQQIRE